MAESAVPKTDRQVLQSSKHLSNEHQEHLQLDCLDHNDSNFLKVPKRKLSVFYRSFDVIEAKSQEDTLEFRRTSSSPSVRLNEPQDEETRGKEVYCETSSCRKGFVNNCRSLIESGKFLGGSTTDQQDQRSSGLRCSQTRSSSPMTGKLPLVRDDKIVDNCATIEKQCKLNSNGIDVSKGVDENIVDDATSRSSLEGGHSERDGLELTSRSEEDHGTTVDRGSSQDRRDVASNGDLVKIKDPAYRGAFVNASSSSVGGERLAAVGAEMSSHEDSSIESDCEEEPIVARSRAGNGEATIEGTKKGDSPRAPSPLTNGDAPGEPDPSGKIDGEKTEDCVQSTPEKRQRYFATKRSLSDGDSKRYHRARRHCGCSKQEQSTDEPEQFQAFPSFTDSRLKSIGLSHSEETSNLYSENFVSPENDLERKYIAFSIGLGTDRITLQRRMMWSLRQRDLAEKNFKHEIEDLEEEIKKLPRCSWCTDGESAGVHVADTYVQKLRSKCENLSRDIAEIKRILLKHNIVIEEGTEEIYDVPLQPSRYRNGLPSNNRTLMARRRASIATISRPLTSQDILKESPRQRNSVSGRVTIRRPSLCTEVRWESEKLNRTDSSESVGELRDISEQTEWRRDSHEENNNLPRHGQASDIDANRDDADNVKDNDRSSSSLSSFLEPRTAEKQLLPCIRTVEPLRIPRNFQTLRPILWYILIFLLGFYAHYVTSSVDTSVANLS
ncbi:PREDICTED: LOW QUALITY PROTEIN: uncharacterized protein LOC107192146 [Dufourea novaeangliae]|uniref:LOW QUALITY PROTEIN: uncharacterized protein LOC107192146 n=1 Tax=Dufourea novaeangliae TaxID=178035 RepID=UPI000767A857|nr:PREDICTED: LOW QUALITY PROTEIN: uncharacterized protein LOC107192146 [Dufourea novaeangliae]